MSDHSLVVLVNKPLLVLESIDTLCGSVIQSYGTASDSSCCYYVVHAIEYAGRWFGGTAVPNSKLIMRLVLFRT